MRPFQWQFVLRTRSFKRIPTLRRSSFCWAQASWHFRSWDSCGRRGLDRLGLMSWDEYQVVSRQNEAAAWRKLLISSPQLAIEPPCWVFFLSLSGAPSDPVPSKRLGGLGCREGKMGTRQAAGVNPKLDHLRWLRTHGSGRSTVCKGCIGSCWDPF